MMAPAGVELEMLVSFIVCAILRIHKMTAQVY